MDSDKEVNPLIIHHKEVTMAFKTIRVNRRSVADRRKSREKRFPSATREEIEKAMKDYLKGGGKIKRIEPEWIVEGSIDTFS